MLAQEQSVCLVGHQQALLPASGNLSHLEPLSCFYALAPPNGLAGVGKGFQASPLPPNSFSSFLQDGLNLAEKMWIPLTLKTQEP